MNTCPSEVKVKSLSHVWLFATPWTVAYQAPPSIGFFRQECWSGLPFPSPGDFPDPGIKPGSPALQADALPSEPPGKQIYLKMGTIKDRNSKDLTEAEEIKKGWQEYTELYRKYFNYLDNHDGDHSSRARHPGKWSQLGFRKHHSKQTQWRWWDSSWSVSNPKRWCCENASLNMPANLENSAEPTGLENVNFHPNPKERQCQRMFRLLHNWTHLTHLQSNAQNLQARLQQYVNHELPDVQAGFRKDRGTRDQIANINWIIEKARQFL